MSHSYHMLSHCIHNPEQRLQNKESLLPQMLENDSICFSETCSLFNSENREDFCLPLPHIKWCFMSLWLYDRYDKKKPWLGFGNNHVWLKIPNFSSQARLENVLHYLRNIRFCCHNNCLNNTLLLVYSTWRMNLSQKYSYILYEK